MFFSGPQEKHFSDNFILIVIGWTGLWRQRLAITDLKALPQLYMVKEKQ